MTYDRPKGLGSSDAANILGCGFDTALHTYLTCIGEPVPKDQNPLLALGTFLEPFITEQYEKRTGYTLAHAIRHVPSVKYDFLFSSIDRWVEPAGDYFREHIVELKYATTWEGWGPEGTDEVPLKYYVQASHQMLTSGAERADIAALGPRGELRVYQIPRRDSYLQALLDAELHFWHEHVLKRIPPDVDWEHPDAAKLYDLIHRPDGREVKLDLTDDMVADCYQSVSERIGELEKQKAEARAWLAERMGTASVGLLPSERTVKRTVSGESVRLTISKPRSHKRRQ